MMAAKRRTKCENQGRLKVKSRWATDAARCVWCIIADPDDPRRRLFVARRTNFCAEPDGLAFRLSDAGVVWDASQPILLGEGRYSPRILFRFCAESNSSTAQARASREWRGQFASTSSTAATDCSKSPTK